MGFWYELEKVIIVLVGLGIAYVEIRQAVILGGSWNKVCLGVMGLYWSVYYAYSLYRTAYDLRLPQHQVFVRSGILLTLAVILAGAIKTLRMLRSRRDFR